MSKEFERWPVSSPLSQINLARTQGRFWLKWAANVVEAGMSLRLKESSWPEVGATPGGSWPHVRFHAAGDGVFALARMA